MRKIWDFILWFNSLVWDSVVSRGIDILVQNQSFVQEKSRCFVKKQKGKI